MYSVVYCICILSAAREGGWLVGYNCLEKTARDMKEAKMEDGEKEE